MTDNYEHGGPVKEEWLDDVVIDSTEDDVISKEEPGCDVTLKIFDEPYIPPAYTKVVTTVGSSNVDGVGEARMTDDVSSMEADQIRHQYVSTESFGVGSSCDQQVGAAVRLREVHFGHVKVEPDDSDDRQGSGNPIVDAPIDEMTRNSKGTHSCGYTAEESNNFEALKEALLGDSARPFACNTCHFKCSNHYHLKRHMMIHSGEKPFACSHCDYRSHRADKVKRHARTHTGEKPFACSYCDYRASRADHLRAHVRSHVTKGLGKNFSRLLDSE